MEFTDRLMAMDRSVANYRRFSNTSNADVAIFMLVDLLHWHGRFADFNFTLEKAHDMLLEALNTFQSEFEVEKEAANPLRGEREPRRPRSRVERSVHDEIIYDPESAVPLPGASVSMPIIEFDREETERQVAAYMNDTAWDTPEVPDEGGDIEF